MFFGEPNKVLIWYCWILHLFSREFSGNYVLTWLDTVRSWQHATVQVMVWEAQSRQHNVGHSTPVHHTLSICHFWVQCFVIQSSRSSSGGGTLWSFPVPERPEAAEETWSLIRAEAWVAHSLLSHPVNPHQALCELPSCACVWKESGPVLEFDDTVHVNEEEGSVGAHEILKLFRNQLPFLSYPMR